MNKNMPIIGDIKRGTEIGYKDTRKYMWVTCPDCERERWIMLRKDKSKNIRCRNCVNKEKRQGKKHCGWKGGKCKNNAGYVSIWVNSTSPYRSMGSGSHILEHRLVMAKHLGRCLESWEMVHHINHIRDDNRIENLELLEISDHNIITKLENENKRLKEEIKRLKKDCL